MALGLWASPKTEPLSSSLAPRGTGPALPALLASWAALAKLEGPRAPSQVLHSPVPHQGCCPPPTSGLRRG